MVHDFSIFIELNFLTIAHCYGMRLALTLCQIVRVQRALLNCNTMHRATSMQKNIYSLQRRK